MFFCADSRVRARLGSLLTTFYEGGLIRDLSGRWANAEVLELVIGGGKGPDFQFLFVFSILKVREHLHLFSEIAAVYG